MPPAKRGPEPVIVSRETMAIAAVERREACALVHSARRASAQQVAQTAYTCLRGADVGCAFRRSAPLACCEGQMDQAPDAFAPRERNMLST